MDRAGRSLRHVRTERAHYVYTAQDVSTVLLHISLVNLKYNLGLQFSFVLLLTVYIRVSIVICTEQVQFPLLNQWHVSILSPSYNTVHHSTVPSAMRTSFYTFRLFYGLPYYRLEARP